MNCTELRWRKFSPIDRDGSVYELVDGDVIILDVSRGEHGAFEIAYHGGAAGRIYSLAAIERLIGEVKMVLEREEAEHTNS